MLAAVQSAWKGVVGPRLAAEAEPIAERDGVVTVACRAAVWAQELELLSADLLERLNGELPRSGAAGSVAALRFVTRSRGS